MDVALLGLFSGAVLAVLALWAINARAAWAEAARRAAETARTDLDTTRRIDDATRPASDPDAARDWLRTFGADPTGKR